MLPTLERMRAVLVGRRLPGGELTIARHESRIADHALGAVDDEDDLAHPIWYVVASLRGMGISVDEFCDLSGRQPGDTLLLGGIEVQQERPLRVDASYRTEAEVTSIVRKTMRDGSPLDSVTVVVRVLDDAGLCGSVTSAYLFRRGHRG